VNRHIKVIIHHTPGKDVPLVWIQPIAREETFLDGGARESIGSSCDLDEKVITGSTRSPSRCSDWQCSILYRMSGESLKEKNVDEENRSKDDEEN
jgi:hypothetical protein